MNLNKKKLRVEFNEFTSENLSSKNDFNALNHYQHSDNVYFKVNLRI